MNIIEAKLTEVYINSTDKSGQPLRNKSGEEYKMCNIKIEGNDNRLSLYLGKKFGQKDYEVVSQWQPGMTVKIVIEQNGTYWNFKLPNKNDELAARINAVENFIRKIVMLNNLKIKE